MNPVLRHLRMNIMETIKRQKILAESRGALWNQRQLSSGESETDRQTVRQLEGEIDLERQTERRSEIGQQRRRRDKQTDRGGVEISRQTEHE